MWDERTTTPTTPSPLHPFLYILFATAFVCLLVLWPFGCNKKTMPNRIRASLHFQINPPSWTNSMLAIGIHPFLFEERSYYQWVDNDMLSHNWDNHFYRNPGDKCRCSFSYLFKPLLPFSKPIQKLKKPFPRHFPFLLAQQNVFENQLPHTHASLYIKNGGFSFFVE